MGKDKPVTIYHFKDPEKLDAIAKKAFEEGRCGAGILHTGKDDPFLEACKIHDSKYSVSVGAQSEADRELSSNMWKRVKAEQSFLRRNLLAVRATIYDGLVRIFGPILW